MIELLMMILTQSDWFVIVQHISLDAHQLFDPPSLSLSLFFFLLRLQIQKIKVAKLNEINASWATENQIQGLFFTLHDQIFFKV